MSIEHTKCYGIYYWDTFDNETILIREVDTLEEAIAFVKKEYKDRIHKSGADQIDIVDLRGNIVEKFSIM